MKYIRSVYNKEYNDGNHDESIYTIYLYTSHYIENINYDKSFSDKKILDILYMQILFRKMIKMHMNNFIKLKQVSLFIKHLGLVQME